MLPPLKRDYYELEKDLKNKEWMIMACEPKQLINDFDYHVATVRPIRDNKGITIPSDVAPNLVLLSHFHSHSIIMDCFF